MKWLTIDQIIAALRLDAEQAELERGLLELYGRSAERSVLTIVRRSHAELIDTYGEMPAELVQASLLHVDRSYKDRSPVEQQQLGIASYSFDMLVRPYMKLDGEVNIL